jgi:hypothetical protein
MIQSLPCIRTGSNGSRYGWKIRNERCIMEHDKDTCSPMEEPRPRIVRDKTYSHGISYFPHTYSVSPDWVDEVRCALTRSPYDGKIVLRSAS